MSRRAAILGLGKRGAGWADACAASGWHVTGFDPDPTAGAGAGARRADRISEAVAGADLVLLCLPERLELVQMVLQRAQAAAGHGATICVASDAFDVEALQSCAIRPGQVFRLSDTEAGAVALDMSSRNSPDVCKSAEGLLAELMAYRSLASEPLVDDYRPDAESA